MDLISCAYIPGKTSELELPLARLLPPLRPGMVSGWLKQYAKPGDWVLDPFGSTPVLPLEAAEAGFRVLVASNNPVLSFITEILAKAPSNASLQAALSDLSDMRRGDERLDIHLQSLYQTECAVCGQTIQAEAFLWKKGDPLPYGRIYHCPHCSDEGEKAFTPRDAERLAIPGNPNLHRARAFERVNLGLEDLRDSIQDALNTYLARPLYFLNTLINRIEGLPAASPHRDWLTAMALVVCDEANSIWPYPSPRQRPRQLTVPTQFRENNLWLALENSIQSLTCWKQPAAFTRWPDLPPDGKPGICLYPGRLKNLLPLPTSVQPSAAIGVFPRPNQAFWTLSAIWSGWLWGKEALIPLKGSLERQRYDWNWHTTALTHLFSTLREYTPDHFPFIGFLPEVVSGFMAAAVVAGEASDFHLQGLAFREEDELAQMLFRSGPVDPTIPLNIEDACQDSIENQLANRNEPASYINLFSGCLQAHSHLSAQGVLAKNHSRFASESLTQLLPMINKVFSNRQFLMRYESVSSNLEIGQWWLAVPPENKLTLSDRLEIEVVHFLQKHPDSLLDEIDDAMCRAFPGLETPSRNLIKTIVDSYADQSPEIEEGWRLRANESAASRRNDLLQTRIMLKAIGNRISFDCSGETPVIWKDKNGKEAFQFYSIASSLISRYVLNQPITGTVRRVLVIPGGRSNLIAYKLKQDPRLAEAVSEGWVFLKYRHLRQLAERSDLSQPVWEELMDTDPLIFDNPVQMAIF